MLLRLGWVGAEGIAEGERSWEVALVSSELEDGHGRRLVVWLPEPVSNGIEARMYVAYLEER